MQFLGIATKTKAGGPGPQPWASLVPEDVFLVTEFLEGGDLSRLKDPSYSSNWKLRVTILRDIARAMRHIHTLGKAFVFFPPKSHAYVFPATKLGMMHRDLKSGNLLLSEDWTTTKVCDLGLARRVESEVDAFMTCSGSGPWVAPEVIRREAYSFPADIFSYGRQVN